MRFTAALYSFKTLFLTSLLVSYCFGANTITSSADENTLARSAAADADMAFFMAFLDDFETAFPQYTSYMMQNHLTLPQAVADYYYHIADLASTANLESDIAQSFPFTQFETFITAFPWYTSLLEKASATTIYLPQHFLTDDTQPSETSSVYSSQTASTSIAKSTASSTASTSQSIFSNSKAQNNSTSSSTNEDTASTSTPMSSSISSTTQSQNGARANSLYLPMALFGILAAAL
ncbi:hypothetical protein N7582_003739 [Saccharomyces uvarum]|uniref:A-factor barrier protein 1 n=1 Tax=Saccharomyces uvarum TaxID=230603 RepID=A0AA35J2A3_SACUV|nr:hypothetical protein N7582_003739 [Saccharomyces uvarum]CAI4046143.1 hypothetical protein SUVC_12G0980 [Saccharomyces uvarum]